MASIPQIPLPSAYPNFLLWLRDNGDDAVELLNSLALVQVVGVAPGGDNSYPNGIVGLGSPTPIISIPSASGKIILNPLTTTTSLQQTMIQILEVLRGLGTIATNR